MHGHMLPSAVSLVSTLHFDPFPKVCHVHVHLNGDSIPMFIMWMHVTLLIHDCIHYSASIRQSI